jgi:Icc-related predicted phosphoesterase
VKFLVKSLSKKTVAQKILSISDIVVDMIYSPQLRINFQDVDLVISCGDLPYYYLDYIISNLNTALYFVRGNHANIIEYSESGLRKAPLGGVDLHRRAINHKGLLLAGVEGSLRYNRGNFQYTQAEMWHHVLTLVPHLLYNRLAHGRFLDIFITHAPPWKINDQPDRAHQGIKAFRWLIQTFQPTYHLHGHIHIYSPKTISKTQVNNTQVLNVYGYRRLNLAPK